MGMFDFLKPKKKAWKPVPRVLTVQDPRPQDMFSNPFNPMNPISPLNPMYGDSMSGHSMPPSHDYSPPTDCGSSSTPDYGGSDAGCSDGGGGGGGD